MPDNTIEIVIRGKDQASEVIGDVNQQLGGMGEAAGEASAAMDYALGQVAYESLIKVSDAAGQAFGKIVDEAIAAQDASAQLESVIKSTGGVAGITAGEANDLAGQLSSLTRFEDDAILGAESMLLTFTNIGEEVFPDTTAMALDMSQALGQDLKSSAVQLGKALNDPINGVSALQRVGVTFTDSQKDMIKSLVESGQTLEAQKLILQELQKEFGGSAVAAGQTLGGSLDRLNRGNQQPYRQRHRCQNSPHCG